MGHYVIAYDIGTTGMKTCLFRIDKSIELIESDLKDYELTILENGGAEQNPEDWYDAMCLTTKNVLSQSGVAIKAIKGLSFCAQMQGLVLVDEKGHAVRPAMSYMDNRAFNEKKKGLEHGFKIAGMNAGKLFKSLIATGAVPASIKDPIWKYHWVKKYESEIFKKIYKWLDIKEYLISRLTGEFVMTEDSAFATLLFDVKNKVFSKKVCHMFDVDMNHLPKVIKSTDKVGTLTLQASKDLGLSEETAVFGGGGDASLVGVGAGAVDVHDTHIYIGTSGWVSTVVGKKMVDIGSMIASIQGASSQTLNYFAELETAGKCLEWVKDHLALDEIGIYLEKVKVSDSTESIHASLYDFMMTAIRDVPAGSHGIIFTPWLHGNRCPFEDHRARGMFFNIGLENGKNDMIHAVLEGICFHLKWQLETIEKKTETGGSIRFVGGGALSKKTCQILADILNRQVETVENPQNIGSVGAALIAGIGLGYMPSLHEAKKMIAVSDVYHPNKEHRNIYDETFKVFKSLYTQNKKSFAILNEKML